MPLQDFGIMMIFLCGQIAIAITTTNKPISIMRYTLRDRHDAIKCIASYLRKTMVFQDETLTYLN